MASAVLVHAVPPLGRHSLTPFQRSPPDCTLISMKSLPPLLFTSKKMVSLNFLNLPIGPTPPNLSAILSFFTSQTVCSGRNSFQNLLTPALSVTLIFSPLTSSMRKLFLSAATSIEVIFQALDVHVANVAGTYSLEHSGIDELFDSAFQILNVLSEENGNYLKQFQELDYCTATIQTSICQHMLKEEEQVFPLLVQQFSFSEQASLVWQFFCSVPIIFLEDFLPWMTACLPKTEQADVVHCIKEVVPEEKLLQEVVASWLGKKCQSSPTAFNLTENEAALSSNNSLYFKKFHKIYKFWSSSDKENCSQKGSDCFGDNAEYHPIDCLHLWHDSIRKDLKNILDDLCEIKTSKVFSSLPYIGGQLKFLLDVLVFYSDALENVFFPALSEFAKCCLSFSHKPFPNGSHIEGLLCVLHNINLQSGESVCELVEKLCQKVEAFLEGVSKHLTFQESEVFPLIRKHCNHGMQQRSLFVSLHMMPLGLLKCTITWLSAHLSEAESKAVLCSIKLAGSDLNMSFALLLHKWVSLGCSGKISHEMFKRELQEMFRNKSYYLAKNIAERTEFVNLRVHRREKSLLGQTMPKFSHSAKKGALGSSSQKIKEECSTLCSSEINLQIIFPELLKKPSPFSQYLAEKGDASSSLKLEFKPVDYIFLFHKALTNDLNYLVLQSIKMVENVALLEDFRQRFHLLRFLYQIHSDNEDKIAFPALEAKSQLQNISISYTIDHKLEIEYFNQISVILDKIVELRSFLSSELSDSKDAALHKSMLEYRLLCMKLHGKCKTICITAGKHFQREEIELWPLFTRCLSDEEQDKIIGNVLGNTKAEILQQLIPWLMASLSCGEQYAMMSLWRKATKNTMFDEWLAEWWEDMSTHDIASVAEESTNLPSLTVDPLEIVAAYFSKEINVDLDGRGVHDKESTFETEDSVGTDFKNSGNNDGDYKTKTLAPDIKVDPCSERNLLKSKDDEQTIHEVISVKNQFSKTGELLSTNQSYRHIEAHILTMSQEDLEAVIIRVHRDTTLDPQKKSYIIQTLRTSRWTIAQQKPRQEVMLSSNDGVIPGQCPSYRDPLTFGCKHYKRNCKVFATCCEKLYTCRYCHDEAADHLMDRKSTKTMMCMICLKLQPISATCSTISCNGLSMGKYFCRICRLFDDEREIYHCPYCNLCRLGKGLGSDFFHCMNCNACMSQSLAKHICLEKCFESNCPICHEDIFTSSSPVKALPCGHMMHSTCFQDYTRMHYICPICSKSLGDMQVYFRMLDAWLAEEKAPDYGQTQVILCNDCEKRGIARFHWHHHKCSHCGSYNTRLL